MKKTYYIYAALGAIIGTLLIFSPGTLFVIALATLICFFVLKYLPAAERKFVMWVFIMGLALRMVTAVTLDLVALAYFKDSSMQKVMEKDPVDTNNERLIKEKTRAYFEMGDSDYYSARGYVYAAHAKGIDNIIIRHYLGKPGLGYGWHAYLYIIGLFYYLFDYSPISVKFINSLIGVLAAVFIYKISLTLSKRIARIALLFTMFVPSMIMWSTANFKEPTLILLNAVTIWAFISFMNSKKIRFLLISLSSIVIQACFTKNELWAISLISVSAVFIATLSLRRKIILGLLLVSVLTLVPKKFSESDFSPRKIVRKLYGQHVGHINTGGGVYKVLDDRYYKDANLIMEMPVGEFAVSATKSIIHFLFEPFPGRMAKLSFLLTYGQVLLWYFLVFFAFFSVFRRKIYSNKNYFLILIYVLSGTLALALGSGNVGTLMRHRDIISPFYFILAAVGIAYIFRLEET